jgi:hypothetical protein
VGGQLRNIPPFPRQRDDGARGAAPVIEKKRFHTMRINRTDTVAGQPIKLARDLVKELERGVGGASIDVVHVTRWILSKGAERLSTRAPRYLHPTKADLAKGRAFLDEMIARGWLEPHKDRNGKTDGSYRCSTAGRSLALANLLNAMPRAKADKVVADLIDRARAINANPELLYWVKELRAFGSFITKSRDLGDLDIAYELERRPIGNSAEWSKAVRQRVEASGKKIAFPMNLFYGQTEVELILKNRSSSLSFHAIDDWKQLKVKSRVIFKRVR